MIKIESLDHLGRGIAKENNKIIFVENAIEDEIIEPKIIKHNKKYDEAIVSKYIKKSNYRINPTCPYYDNCGGCDIMHIPYNKQLQFKQNKIENIISKYLNKNININNIIECNYPYNYRNKITFQVNKDVGFFKKNSNQLIKINNCMICNKNINDSINYLNKLELSKINKITCKSNDRDLMIIIESNYTYLDITPLKKISNSIYIKTDNKYIHKYGEKYIYQNIGEFKYLVSPDSFFQINNNITKKLYDKIKLICGTNNSIIDLYCGTGTIGIYLSKENKVTGIEINKYAYEDANINKKINKIKNIEFLCGDSGKKILSIKENPNIIIVDPPRNGLNKETIQNIIDMNTNKIIYVSCDPMTLVRDLKKLEDYYNIQEITPFDMFPNTHHVECLCLLTKK